MSANTTNGINSLRWCYHWPLMPVLATLFRIGNIWINLTPSFSPVLLELINDFSRGNTLQTPSAANCATPHIGHYSQPRAVLMRAISSRATRLLALLLASLLFVLFRVCVCYVSKIVDTLAFASDALRCLKLCAPFLNDSETCWPAALMNLPPNLIAALVRRFYSNKLLPYWIVRFRWQRQTHRIPMTYSADTLKKSPTAPG